MFWIIVLLVVIVIVVLSVRSSRKTKAREKAEAAAREQKLQEEQERRKALETRAATGDEAAKQELIEQGADVSGFFPYYNFDFDKDAIGRVFNLTELAMIAKGVLVSFDMEEIKDITLPSQDATIRYKVEGKTARGDTIHIQYQVGKASPSRVEYSLHLKELPEVVREIDEMVHKQMEAFLSTVPKWKP
jgi:heme exporter protein D